jgi:hypothetical protein
VFRVGNHVFSAIKLYAHKFGDVIGRVSELFDAAGIGLSIPQVFSDANTLRHSITSLSRAQGLPYSDSSRAIKVAQATKKSFLDSMTLTNTLAQIALFVENTKVFLFKAVHLRVIEGIYNATSIITDGAELIGECFKLKQYHSPEAQPRDPAGVAKLNEKKTLAWITIAKDVASVALGGIALVTIAFGVATSSMTLLSTALLGVSAFWLTMKLTGYFYNKVIVEAPISSPRVIPALA